MVDLAVAIVVGTAFVALVNAFVADILTPIVAAIFGKPDFSGLTFHINGSTFLYGDFLNTLAAMRAPEPGAPSERECPECLSIIPAAARRCSHCTTEVTPATAT